MTSPASEITTPVGRMVAGHPMEVRAVIDQNTNQPKMQKDGVTPMTDSYVAIAIAKGQEQHWNQTAWGQVIWNAGVTGWPNGEYNAPAFAWKITDGDSQVPNQKNKRPCDQEGFPGHWILNASTGLPIRCFHAGRYDPTQQIQNKNEIKRGDYIRLVLSVRGNAPSLSPGVYLNPSLFELTRAGIEIISDFGADPNETLAATQAQLPPGALVDPNVNPADLPPGALVDPNAAAAAAPGVVPAAPGAPTPAPAAAAPSPVTPAPAAPTPAPAQTPVTPAPEFLNAAPPAPEKYTLNGAAYTAEQLRASGWSDAQIAGLPKA